MYYIAITNCFFSFGKQREQEKLDQEKVDQENNKQRLEREKVDEAHFKQINELYANATNAYEGKRILKYGNNVKFLKKYPNNIVFRM